MATPPEWRPLPMPLMTSPSAEHKLKTDGFETIDKDNLPSPAVYVSNIPANLSSDEILETIFKQAGWIEDISSQIYTTEDGAQKCHAVIQYEFVRSAAVAIIMFNGSAYSDSIIQVNYHRSDETPLDIDDGDPSRALTIYNWPYRWDEKDLYRMFSGHGTVVRSEIKLDARDPIPLRKAEIEYCTTEVAAQMKRGRNNSEMEGSILVIRFSGDKSMVEKVNDSAFPHAKTTEKIQNKDKGPGDRRYSVQITGLDPQRNLEKAQRMLRERFCPPYGGKIVKVEFRADAKGDLDGSAVVRYFTEAQAQTALDTQHYTSQVQKITVVKL